MLISTSKSSELMTLRPPVFRQKLYGYDPSMYTVHDDHVAL